MGAGDRKKGPRDFYSGRLNEGDVLGEFRATPEGIRAFRAAVDKRGYMTPGDAMGLIRKFTKGDPTNPSQPFARELRLAVIEQLGLEDEQDMDRVRFFSAVGTPLDVFHGIDGWIEFVPDQGPPRIVTLDVTLDPGKEEHKADIIVQEVPDPSEDEKRFLALVYNTYAPQVAQKLRTAVAFMMRDRREREQPAA